MAQTNTTIELALRLKVAGIPADARASIIKDNGKKGADSKVALELSGWVNPDKSLKEFLSRLGDDFKEVSKVLEDLTGGLDIKLDSLAFRYHADTNKVAEFAVTFSMGRNRCRFVCLKQFGTGGGYVAGLELRLDKEVFKNDLASGLIGEHGLLGELSLGDLGIYYVSADADLRGVPYDPDLEFPRSGDLMPIQLSKKTRDFKSGLNWTAQISIGDKILFDWPRTDTAENDGKALADDAPKLPEAEPLAGKQKGSSSPTTWLDVNKSLGPLSVRRVGFAYEAPRVGIKFDAGLQLSVLSLTLEGLGLSYPLDQLTNLSAEKIWKNLKFHLDGATVVFERGPLTIGGGLLKVSDEPLQLDGFLLIRTAGFAISAIGSYANLSGTPSFFIFAILDKSLGGDPAFFITGLAFGLGVHRDLKLPTIDEVQNFPLVRAAMDPNYLGKELNLPAISQKLKEYISPSLGNIWIAAGLKFTTYGLIESFAVLSVSFGTRFEIALLGLSRIELMKPGPVIARIEIAIRVVIDPQAGFLAVEARLTENSFILDKGLKLSGGAAFYLWFGGDHAGDFVLSVGGYHPKFQPPPHYPKPDRVAFYCKIDDVTIQGHCYFALCSAAIMAGGGLSVVYQSKSGAIKAWFIAYADFLVQWKPVYYSVAIGISVGIALRLSLGDIRFNLTLELAASINLHGPPLGGEATISLYIISFTVKFGAAKKEPPSLKWDDDDKQKSFAKSFLPADVTGVTITDGLLAEVKRGDETNRFVSAHRLVLRCRSRVPATVAACNGLSPDFLKFNHPLGVRPMGETTLYSKLDVALKPVGDEALEVDCIELSPIRSNVPQALWANGRLDTNAPPKNQTIENALLGVEIKTKAGFRPSETPALDMEVLSYDPFPKYWNCVQVEITEALPGKSVETISKSVRKPAVAEKRAKIVGVLAATGRRIMEASDIDLMELEEKALYIYQAMPKKARVGQEPPRDSRN